MDITVPSAGPKTKVSLSAKGGPGDESTYFQIGLSQQFSGSKRLPLGGSRAGCRAVDEQNKGRLRWTACANVKSERWWRQTWTLLGNNLRSLFGTTQDDHSKKCGTFGQTNDDGINKQSDDCAHQAQEDASVFVAGATTDPVLIPSWKPRQKVWNGVMNQPSGPVSFSSGT